MRYTATRVRGALLIAVAVVCGIIALAYLLFPAHRATDALDRAPDTLVVPDYYDELFFQGQGFPVARRFVATGTREIDGMRVHVLPYFDHGVSYKSTQETLEQVNTINARYAPNPPWQFRPDRRLGHYKCMATSTSMLLDWFRLQQGNVLPPYTSIFDGRTYNGYDPRAIDAAYYEHAEKDPELFELSDDDHLDPVTGVPVPFSVAAFAQLVEEETLRGEPRTVRDRHLPLEHTLDLSAVGALHAVRVLSPTFHWRALLKIYPEADSLRLRDALETYGPLLAGIKIRFSALHGVFRDTRLGDFPIVGPSGHGVLIVGWIEKNDRLYFLYRETFGDCDEETVECGPAYRVYPVYGFNEAFGFSHAGHGRGRP
ncbi:MAG: hypothetical protein U0V87_18180 [Acidobacteriota bacterium]